MRPLKKTCQNLLSLRNTTKKKSKETPRRPEVCVCVVNDSVELFQNLGSFFSVLLS